MSQPLAVVLAAGKGTRMKSDLPKVLVETCGRPMLEYVLDALEAGGICHSLVVVGYRSDLVREALADREHVDFVEQSEQLGTGHAVQVCAQHLEKHDGAVLIVTGDSPLTQSSSIAALLDLFHRERPACILGTAHKDDPTGLGRIVRSEQGEFVGIVEQKDTTPQQQQITEVNMSTYVFNSRDLTAALGRLSNDNQQGEYYITDYPGILKSEGKVVKALDVLQPCESLSINTLDDLHVVESEMRRLGYS